MENYHKAVEALNHLTDAEVERAIQERKERGRRRVLADEERERGGLSRYGEGSHDTVDYVLAELATLRARIAKLEPGA